MIRSVTKENGTQKSERPKVQTLSLDRSEKFCKNLFIFFLRITLPKTDTELTFTY